MLTPTAMDVVRPVADACLQRVYCAQSSAAFILKASILFSASVLPVSDFSAAEYEMVRRTWQ